MEGTREYNFTLGNEIRRSKGSYRGVIKKKRPYTDDTVYLIAIGIIHSETPFYVGLQLDRTIEEIKSICQQEKSEIFYNLGLCSKWNLGYNDKEELYSLFMACTANRQTHIKKDERKVVEA